MTLQRAYKHYNTPKNTKPIMRSPARKDTRPLVKHSRLTMCVYMWVYICEGKQWAKIDARTQISDFYEKLCKRRNRGNYEVER